MIEMGAAHEFLRFLHFPSFRPTSSSSSTLSAASSQRYIASPSTVDLKNHQEMTSNSYGVPQTRSPARSSGHSRRSRSRDCRRLRGTNLRGTNFDAQRSRPDFDSEFAVSHSVGKRDSQVTPSARSRAPMVPRWHARTGRRSRTHKVGSLPTSARSVSTISRSRPRAPHNSTLFLLTRRDSRGKPSSNSSSSFVPSSIQPASTSAISSPASQQIATASSSFDNLFPDDLEMENAYGSMDFKLSSDEVAVLLDSQMLSIP
jgi:hypothetical protein